MFCIPHVCPNKYMIGLAEQIVLHPSPSPPTSPPPPHLCWKLVSSIVHPATPPPPPSPLHTYDGNYFQHCLPTHPPTLSPLPHLPPPPWTPSQHVCWKPGEGGGGGGWDGWLCVVRHIQHIDHLFILLYVSAQTFYAPPRVLCFYNIQKTLQCFN
jgi:hypothetical protein